MDNKIYRMCESELDEILKLLIDKHPKTCYELDDYSIVIKEMIETYEVNRKELIENLAYYCPELNSFGILADYDGRYGILDLEEYDE